LNDARQDSHDGDSLIDPWNRQHFHEARMAPRFGRNLSGCHDLHLSAFEFNCSPCHPLFSGLTPGITRALLP
ncbi:MAG: hypothetical protein LC729_04920, partial [Acidobacteria bacterium]|nr:hypothetical protein [Acidobacteriota bacterium]